MLALDRPLGVVAGLSLFGDHADPDRVYYLPTRPRVARVGTRPDDPPEISFVKFRRTDPGEEGGPDGGGVGLFSFTTELRVTDAELEAAREHLIDLGVARPVLAQAPWVGGKAVFAAALAEGDGFVEKMIGEVTPDLAGSNRALFSLLLDEDGARLVEALVEGGEGDAPEVSPLGVRYELEFAGLRPALDVRIRADYERIYDELSWGFEVGAAYEGIGVRAGVESATQRLIEEGAIQVEVLHFTDDADLHARVDQAVRWFQEQLLEELFQSSLEPPAQKSLLERATEAATALGAATLQDALADAGIAAQLAEQLGISPDILGRLGAAGGGGEGMAEAPVGGESSFALKLQFTFRDIDRRELKTVTLDWTEARAERRTAAPQGLLATIGPPPSVVEVEDAGTFWDRMDVTVRPLGDFAELGVERLVVQLAYPDEDDPSTERAVTFAPGEADPARFAPWTDGGPPTYRARTEVHFADDGPWPGPPVYVGPWRTRRSRQLAVHPLSEVPRVEVELAPGGVDLAETPQVEVDLRLDGVEVASHMLSADAPTARFRRRLAASALEGPPDEDGEPTERRPLLEARPTWYLAAGGREEGDWTPVEGTTFLVHAPWRSHRTVRLFPLLPDDILQALVTLTLAENGRSRTAEIELAAGDRRVRTVSLPSLAEEPPPARVDVLVIRGDGSVFTAVPFETTDPVVMVRDRDGDQRRVRVRLLAGERLADHGLMAVKVELVGEGDEGLDAVVFTESEREPATMLVPVEGEAGGGGEVVVRYRVVRYGLDGAPRVSEVVESDEAELLVPAVG